MHLTVRPSASLPLFLFIFLWCYSTTFSQPSVLRATPNEFQQYLQFDTTESLEFLVTLLPPFLIQNGIELKEFIRSEEFLNLRTALGDSKAIDAIFVRSMQLTKNNTGIALLLTTLATFDHRIVQFDVPVFLLAFPLTDESEDEFDSRVKNLPTRMFSDTPNYHLGDRDKLQHFFGSAFVTFIFESRGTAERLGAAIEQGEQAIVIGGRDDDRDARANVLGQQFGLALMENPFQYPSEFLLHGIATMDTKQLYNTLEFENGFDSCR